MQQNLSEKLIKRLSLYHHVLVDYEYKHIEHISSPVIAELLRIDDSQVRKDLKLLTDSGKCKVGYLVKDVKSAIEKTLGFKDVKDAFIVGAGNLALALAKYDNFLTYGLRILALFDNDPLKINMTVNGKEIFHISKLANLAMRLKVENAILTVPRAAAQESADFLVSAGIKFIWNFTPCILKVPADVQVCNENLIGNFLYFTAEQVKNKKSEDL